MLLNVAHDAAGSILVGTLLVDDALEAPHKAFAIILGFGDFVKAFFCGVACWFFAALSERSDDELRVGGGKHVAGCLYLK
ncbi:MAG TPA: hypothetical protein VKP65_22220 [Rhodothermales bacterium]|nr:hypothetical protein [Rhodothermales bacterium]